MADEVTLDFIGKQLERMLDEQRAMRTELRRFSENQVMIARSLENARSSVDHLRDDLEVMIRTEIGGLFAHLETRLEQRIGDALAKAT